MPVLFQAKEDVANRRKVVLHGKIVTIIDIAGRTARIAEDGKWYDHDLFFPLTEEHIQQDIIQKVTGILADKKIAMIKPEATGVEFIMEDNTRLVVSYSPKGGLALALTDQNGCKVV